MNTSSQNSNIRNDPPKKLLLTVREVAEMLNVGKSSVYAWASAGILKPVILPSAKPSRATKRNKKAIRFRPEVVDDFLKSL